MIFDQFARMIERHHPARVGMVESARLFELPYVPHEILPRVSPAAAALEDFVLPFPEVAVEDRTSCTFLFDNAPNQVGFGTARRFIDVQRTGTGSEAYTAMDPSFRLLQETGEELFIANFGSIDQIVTHGERFAVQGVCELQVLFTRDRLIDVTSRANLRSLGEDVIQRFDAVLRNAVTALEELLLISGDHETFVLESTPLRPRHAKPGRITRSHDRPVYTLLRPDQIRRRLGLSRPGPGEGSKSPHERRRHWRHLQSEFYTRKRGEKVLVPACWVGPSEAVTGQRRYRVRLDI
jgi:hypothetical protein